MKKWLLFSLLSLPYLLAAQEQLKGVVADSATRKGLPFATLQADKKGAGVITDINGRFTLSLNGPATLTASYIAHVTKTVSAAQLKNGDTIFLAAASTALEEVIIRSDEKKIARIVNTAIRNKPLHNPEQYGSYECQVYYKMSADLLGLDFAPVDSTKLDSTQLLRRKQWYDSTKGREPEVDFLSPDRHLLFAETFSKRLYKKPQQVQEVVLASRFSGFTKTYFHNAVTDVLPFHIYTDFISLGGLDYSNPVARGWQGRYRFRLQDEVLLGADTVFLLAFEPAPGKAFNGLQGVVYINTNGYAISHFIAATGDTTKDRQIRFEQVYQYIRGKWFPRELNYELVMQHMMARTATLQWNGHSIIDSVYFDKPPSVPFDKAHPVRLHDSIDLRTDADWQRYRSNAISPKEALTYAFVDSFSKKYRLESIINATSRLHLGRVPLGKVDIDINRLLAQNSFEGTRLGVGFYTNDKLWKQVSIGGWTGYGFRDHRWKGGVSASFYLGSGKESWLSLGWQDTYRAPGEVRIHEDLTRTGLRNWLLGQPERLGELSVSANLRAGYWELQPTVAQQKITSLAHAFFTTGGKTFSRFRAAEIGIGIRYAFAERRVPVFDYYMPQETKYPIVYLRVNGGKIASGNFQTGYIKTVAAVTYTFHGNRWGRDQYRLEGGWVSSLSGQPLPRTLLLAGNGIRMNRSGYYSTTGFVTMRPFDYYNDRYISLLYKHDFDRFFWDTKWSKPFLSLVHNMAYGSLDSKTILANNGIVSFEKGYHESGLLINQLLRYNLRVTDVYFNTGFFYHWDKGAGIKQNTFWVFSFSTGF
jgi:hypothetical protein